MGFSSYKFCLEKETFIQFYKIVVSLMYFKKSFITQKVIKREAEILSLRFECNYSFIEICFEDKTD